MARALEAEEKVLYLLYSPIWDSRPALDGEPVEPASHAVAVTRKRFVVTRDSHAGASPETWSVPFDDLLAVELGRSVLSGWLLLHFVAAGRRFRLPVVFHATAGGQHFAAAVRAYRRARALHEETFSGTGNSTSWDEAWIERPHGLKEVAEGVLLPDEALCAFLPTLPAATGGWRGPRSRTRRRGGSGLLLLTDRSLLYLRRTDEERGSPLDFGVAATVLPLEALDGMNLDGEALDFHLSRQGVRWSVRLRSAARRPASEGRFQEFLERPRVGAGG
jgi:hypothetical protein